MHVSRQMENARAVDEMSLRLEALGGAINLGELEDGVTLDGTWRLLYSSAFNSGESCPASHQ